MGYNVLILGASYGSLLGTRLLMAGHDVSLVCTASTAALIEREGTLVRFPAKGNGSPLEISSFELPGALSAHTPDAVDAADYDLVVLGMQESQYGSSSVRELMLRIALARKPCLAIMNMPPLPYLQRIPGLHTEPLEGSYTDPRVWDGFDPALVTLASPDPQAFRPPEEPKNVLQVGLATNFKAARFEAHGPTTLLRRIAAGMDCARYVGSAEVPVKLKVHESTYVPLAKWPMLVTGNYRCIGRRSMVSIREAVHGDLEASRTIYDWVASLCVELGADESDLVPFDKYAQAALDLAKPSAAARALASGSTHIERVDLLIRCIARQIGMRFEPLQQIVTLVDERLRRNREAAQTLTRERDLVLA